jgi:hypothetical protein
MDEDEVREAVKDFGEFEALDYGEGVSATEPCCLELIAVVGVAPTYVSAQRPTGGDG